MGLGVEIIFVFDVEEPSEIFYELQNKFDFDGRNGLNLLMSGQDAIEVIDDYDRLMRMLEKKLNIDLSILDYWKYCNDNKNDDFISLDLLLKKMYEFKTTIENHPNFYKEISYGFDIENRYLNQQLYLDISYLIQRINLNIENGAKKVRFESYP